MVGQYVTVICCFLDHKYCSHQCEELLSALTEHERAVDGTVFDSRGLGITFLRVWLSSVTCTGEGMLVVEQLATDW